MATEKDFETLLARYPELIEDGLQLRGRQVTVHGRRMDLLFEDRFGRRLITELKWGPIKDEHIGQLMAYEGLLLSGDDPSLRVMLIGTRVPLNIQRTLDHHGIAWKEISPAQISSFVLTKNDKDMAGMFGQIDNSGSNCGSFRSGSRPKTQEQVSMPGTAPALFVPVDGSYIRQAFKYLQSGKQELYFATNANIGRAADLGIRYVYFKSTGENTVCALAAFIDVIEENPVEKRLPGHESLMGRYYYGFRHIKWLPSPVRLTDLKYFTTGNALRNDVQGARIVQESGQISVQT